MPSDYWTSTSFEHWFLLSENCRSEWVVEGTVVLSSARRDNGDLGATGSAVLLPPRRFKFAIADVGDQSRLSEWLAVRVRGGVDVRRRLTWLRSPWWLQQSSHSLRCALIPLSAQRMSAPSLPAPALVADSEKSQPLYKPPAGGDLVLRSSDETEFSVHSVLMKVASSVFDGMLTGTVKDVVELAENAATVSLMLRFIYPTKTPIMTSIDELSECLSVAQKYDIEGAIENLDEQLASNNAPYHLPSSNPIRVYQLAVQFSLSKTMAATAPLITSDILDFCDPRNYSQLIQEYPTSNIFRIMGLQGARAKILSDILFDFNKAPILPSSDDFYYELTCASCHRWADNTNRKALFRRVPTSWLLAWVRVAYRTLLVAPLERSDHLFEPDILMKLRNENDVCQACINDFWEYPKQQQTFEQWAKRVKVVLAERLEGLGRLYAL